MYIEYLVGGCVVAINIRYAMLSIGSIIYSTIFPDEKRLHGSHKAPKIKSIIAIERKSAFYEKSRREP